MPRKNETAANLFVDALTEYRLPSVMERDLTEQKL